MKYLAYISLFFISSIASAQVGGGEDPVHLYLTEDSTDANTYFLEVQVDSSWMMYDSIPGDMGPSNFTITSAKANLVIASVVKPKVKKKYDDIFESDIYYVQGRVKYVLKTTSSTKLSGYLFQVEYMCCNVATGVCLPPFQKQLKIVNN